MTNQPSKQVRISADLHHEVKLRSFQSGSTITEFTEEALRHFLSRVEPKEIHKISTLAKK